ncbi:MAG: glycogen/starch/alpha-glucan phosphorylase [Candidatus Methylacidiphilales bacterium]|nr:glycogen/starch/alpha-glucan phosphorylase [Candidatus Methylacidiphilales bacterium]
MSPETTLPTPLANPTVESVKASILEHLTLRLARDPSTATPREWMYAVSMAANDHIFARLLATQAVHNNLNVRRVHYLSLEFLMGRMLSNNLYNTGIYDLAKEAVRQLGLGRTLRDIRNEEYDMGLGNGGLGRLAACFLDSLATQDYPAIGYGIHYEFGLFKQAFVNGYQIEQPDDWMMYGQVWEVVRPEYTQEVKLFGYVENVFDELGNYRPQWRGYRTILGIPYDIPIAGYDTKTVNFLRLWESRAAQTFDLDAFNRGGYGQAVEEKNFGETISKVLYPNDSTENGKELRLVQQYFFVTCSLKDIIRRYRRHNADWSAFADKVAIQLNDTHPAVAVAELMRILHDEENLPWAEAWSIVTRTFGYTNHTLLPEALERWSVPLFQKVLPRHLQIILEINRRHLIEVEKQYPGDVRRMREMSLIEEGHPQMIRMAHLAVVGSHSVNGVAALHTELLKKFLFSDFDAFYPGKFNNKTNGVTPRRWMLSSNPRLCSLIDRHIGKGWLTKLDRLRELEHLADDTTFRTEFMAIKRHNKEHLARLILDECGVAVSPDALFDVQIKRLHEYKRQHLNLLHILTLYRRLLQNPQLDIHPRVFIFAAKAAPGYQLAKTIIKAINAVGERINNDPRIGGKIKVVFLPNYRVSLASKIIPAADLSEQISTAGKEASGTGNMKLALNGAVTIGTLDGANVEIMEEVGLENIFIFGLKVEEVADLLARGYDPRTYYEADEELKAVVDWLGSTFFTPHEQGLVLDGVRHSLIEGGDPYLCLADYRAYCEAQSQVDAAYRDKDRWARMAVLNTARCGKFSSDRTIQEYAEQIWNLPKCPVP